jgi:integrase
LSLTDVQCIQSLKIADGKRRIWRQLVLDVFLFCLYSGGMPLVDVAFLCHDQIQDDHIIYHRRKTGEQVKIPLTSEIRSLINQYKREGSNKVFPLLNWDEDRDKDNVKLFMRMTSRYNRTLIVLGKMAGVRNRLTHYVARHTWATIASGLAIPVFSISRCLGHTNVRTTQIYTTDLNNHLADEAIRLVQAKLTLNESG